VGRVVVAAAFVTVAVFGTALSADAGRDPSSPRLHPVARDVHEAHAVLLTRADLPAGFSTFNSGASPTNNSGSCNGVDLDLSALTESAEVYGAGLQNDDSGADYVPSVYVFISAKQAAQAQALYTARVAWKCSLQLAHDRLRGLPATVTGQKLQLVAKTMSGVSVRARQAVLTVRAVLNARSKKFLVLRVEASLIFFRRGRAVAEVWTVEPWTTHTQRTWNDAVSAVVRRLRDSSF